jgi:hypothetical protein
MIEATKGTLMSRQVSIARAIASAWPRASASMPGKAPLVSTKVRTGSPKRPARLPIALRLRHAEIVAQPRLGVGALFGAERHHTAPAKPADAADHRPVLGKGAIARERYEFGQQSVDVVETMRPLRVAGHLDLLPRREPGVGLAQQSVGGAFEAADLVGNVEFAGGGKMAELFDLALELRDRPLEIQEMPDHLRRASGCAVSTSLRNRSLRTCV